VQFFLLDVLVVHDLQEQHPSQLLDALAIIFVFIPVRDRQIMVSSRRLGTGLAKKEDFSSAGCSQIDIWESKAFFTFATGLL
jgi:hypothetical protein